MNVAIILFICLRVLSSLFMILLLAGLIAAIYRRASPARFRRGEIMKISAMRYARGEIDADAYRIMNEDLAFLK